MKLHISACGLAIGALASTAGACGDNLKATPDATVGQDGPTGPDAATPTAALRIDESLDITLANRPVFFFDADGTLLDEAVTSASGVATGEMVAGGSVAAVLEDVGPSFDAVVVFRDIDPDDEVVLDQFVSTPLPSRSFTITAPVYPAAVSYDLHSDCSYASSVTPSFDVEGECATSTPVLLRALDVNGFIMASIYADNVATTTDTALDTWITPQFSTVTWTGLSPLATNVDVLAWRATGNTTYNDPILGVGNVGATAASASGSLPAFTGDVRSRVSLRRPGFAEKIHYARVTYDPVLDVDVSRDLPWFSNASFLPDTGAFTLTQEGAGTSNLRSFSAQVARGPRTMVWLVVDGGAAANRVDLPTLPASHAAFNPSASDLPAQVAATHYAIPTSLRTTARLHLAHHLGDASWVLPALDEQTSIAVQE